MPSEGRLKKWEKARNSFFKNLLLSVGAISLTLVRVIELHSWALPLFFVSILLAFTWLGETFLRPGQRRIFTSLLVLTQVLLYWEKLGPEVLVGLLVVAHLWSEPVLTWWKNHEVVSATQGWLPNPLPLARSYRRIKGSVRRIRRGLHGSLRAK